MRLFLRRLDLWLTTADEPEAMVHGDADDLLLLGETIHHHLVVMVEGEWTDSIMPIYWKPRRSFFRDSQFVWTHSGYASVHS